jgi:hypothetical protein
VSKIQELVLAFCGYLQLDNDDESLIERLRAPEIGKLIDIQAAAAFEIRYGVNPEFVKDFEGLLESAIVQDALRNVGSELATPESTSELSEVLLAVQDSETPWLMISQIEKSQRFIGDPRIRSAIDARIPEILATLHSLDWRRPPYLERGIIEIIVSSDLLLNTSDIREALKSKWRGILFWQAYGFDEADLCDIVPNLRCLIFGETPYSTRELESDIERAFEDVDHVNELFRVN